MCWFFPHSSGTYIESYSSRLVVKGTYFSTARLLRSSCWGSIDIFQFLWRAAQFFPRTAGFCIANCRFLPGHSGIWFWVIRTLLFFVSEGCWFFGSRSSAGQFFLPTTQSVILSFERLNEWRLPTAIFVLWAWLAHFHFAISIALARCIFAPIAAVGVEAVERRARFPCSCASSLVPRRSFGW